VRGTDVRNPDDRELDIRVHANQERLASDLTRAYDFSVCGAGSSDSVVARRLAEDRTVSVLLLEAGGGDDVPGVTEPGLWQTNLGGVRDWAFRGEPNPNLNGRALGLSMGKVLGGGSSINVMTWARGHQADWDHFAAESGNEAWGYDSVRGIYRRIEDWHGTSDSLRHAGGGPVGIEPSGSTHPAGPAAVEAARVLGVAHFDHPNGTMLECAGGAAVADNSPAPTLATKSE